MEFYTPEKDKKSIRQKQTKSADLPTAFLIGDSISCGYTNQVRELLKGKWNVQRPDTNCGDTFRGLELIDEWLDGKKWDVIHFNWGLHDLCYRHPEAPGYGHRDKIKGTQTMTPEQYGQNLEKLVQRMQKSGDLLIWANTTIIPPGEAGRYEGDDICYNDVAAEIMKRYDIPTNDLHSLTSTFGPELFEAPCDVHFSEEGYAIIAKQVAEAIEDQAAKKDIRL